MCGPAMALIGPVVSGIGSAMGAAGQANATEVQAQHYRNQAQRERYKGQYLSEQEAYKQKKVTGEQKAAIGSSGLDQASFDSVISDFETQKAQAIAAIRWSAENQARSNDEQADAKEAEADAIRTGGMFGAIAPVIGGVSKAVSMGGLA